MHKTVMMAVAMAAVMASSGVMAADAAGAPNKEKQMEKLGALRGRLMLKISELPKLMDENQNGARAAYNAVGKIQGEVSQAVQKQLQEENAKAQEVRFQPTIDNLNKKYQKNGDMWNDFNQKDWGVYSRKMNDLNQVYNGLNQIFQSVANLEMSWNNAGFDLDALSALLAMLEKKTDECKVQAQAIAGDLTKEVAVWEAFAKE